PDYEKIVRLFGGHVRDWEMLGSARECMGDFERSRMLAAQTGHRRRIAPRIRGDLLGRAQAGRNRQHHAIEEVPAGNLVHERTFQCARRNPISKPSMPRRVGRPAVSATISGRVPHRSEQPAHPWPRTLASGARDGIARLTDFDFRRENRTGWSDLASLPAP